MLDLTEGRPKEFNLAITIALEHFTAIISRHLLADPRYLEGADPEAAEIWRWHAMEEIEHKGLVFDVRSTRRRTGARGSATRPAR